MFSFIFQSRFIYLIFFSILSFFFLVQSNNDFFPSFLVSSFIFIVLLGSADFLFQLYQFFCFYHWKKNKSSLFIHSQFYSLNDSVHLRLNSTVPFSSWISALQFPHYGKQIFKPSSLIFNFSSRGQFPLFCRFSFSQFSFPISFSHFDSDIFILPKPKTPPSFKTISSLHSPFHDFFLTGLRSYQPGDLPSQILPSSFSQSTLLVPEFEPIPYCSISSKKIPHILFDLNAASSPEDFEDFLSFALGFFNLKNSAVTLLIGSNFISSDDSCLFLKTLSTAHFKDLYSHPFSTDNYDLVISSISSCPKTYTIHDLLTRSFI